VLRYAEHLRSLPAGLPCERKIESFLTKLAKQNVSASTQNQAFNALLFFYREVLDVEPQNINAMRAKRPAHVRVAPSMDDVRRLLEAVGDVHGYPTRLVVRLLYGCGLRVTEPLNLRVKDVLLAESRLVIRGAKGGKDRVVALPCSLVADLRQQLRAARVTWEMDARNRVPVELPGRLAAKYPSAALAWQWAWVFPSKTTCRHPRTGATVRWRMHEANVQRAVKAAAANIGVMMTPHVLRHGYATHALRLGSNVRDIQDALGHSHINTTMGYLTAGTCAVRSPLEDMEVAR
jgi:integrase